MGSLTIATIVVTIVTLVLGVILSSFAKEWGLDEAFRRLKKHFNSIVPPSAVSASTHLHLGNLQITDWDILDGFSNRGMRVITVVDESDVNLPDDLKVLRKQIESELQQKALDRVRAADAGERYALVGLCFNRADDRFESNTCRLDLKHSDYLNFLATSGSLDRKIPTDARTVREKYFSNIDPRIIEQGFLFHSFGVNIAVVTSDNQLVMIRRSKNVAVLPGVFNSSVNEGLSRGLDLELDRSVSIQNVGLRGLHEELRVEADEVVEYKLTSIGFSRKWCQYGALGYARLSITFETLTKRLAISKDATFEIDSVQTEGKTIYAIYGIENSPRAFAAFLEKNNANITSWGLCCYLLSFLSTGPFTFGDLEKCFREAHWKDTSFVA